MNQTENEQVFYVVATPIGNLGDITLRAIDVLKKSDFVLCEDTRVTRNLLARYDIKTPMVSYHMRSGAGKVNHIFNLLDESKTLSLVTDAGTPGISDPGTELVARIREKYPKLKILAIPGASALTAALSVAGLPSACFLFLGFLPNKKGRNKIFAEMASSKYPVVFYESPHRLIKSLDMLKKLLAPERRVAVLRELTKIYEEVIVGNIDEVRTYFENNKDKIRGEIVVIVS